MGLSQMDREIFEGRVRDSQNKIENFSDSTPIEEKFRTYIDLGRAQFSLGNFADAEKSYEKAVETGFKGPLLGNAWYELFTVRYNMKDYENARESIRKAIDLIPDNADYWRALVSLERDDFKASEQILQNLHIFAVEKSNHSPDVIALYANYLESKGDLAGALEQWKRTLAIAPNNVEAKEQIARLEQLIK